MRLRKHAQVAVVLASVAAGLVLVPPSAAQAATGNCNASVQKIAKFLEPDDFRVKAICYTLGAGTEARGTLSVPNDLDVSTVWFTGLNVGRYSRYTKSIFGSPSAFYRLRDY